ncbi:MAG: histidine kinase N-terminal 7TM domain-containing protein [Anaerolineae bacterium]
MSLLDSVYTMALAASAIISALLALYAWPRRESRGGIYFFLLMVAIADWAFGDAAQLGVNTYAAKLLCIKIAYVGIVSVAPLWLAFAADFSQRGAWLTRRRFFLLWLVPLLMLVLVWTNDWHGWVWTQITTVPNDPQGPLVYERGPVALAFPIYSYALLLVGAILVFQATRGAPVLYRKQAWTLLAGLAVPWLGNVLYFLRLVSLPGLDITPIAFAIGATILAWGIVRYRILDLLPVARDVIVQEMNDGVLVLDTQERIVDINPAAYRLIGYDAGNAIGRPVREVLPPWSDLSESFGERARVRDEIELIEETGRRYLDLHISPVYDSRKRVAGRLIVLRDITSLKQTEARLQKYAHELEERNDELDAFAHTVAHDLKNSLASMVTASLLLESYRQRLPDQEVAGSLQNITRTGKKGIEVINELMLLAGVRHKEHFQLGPVDMRVVVAEAEKRLADMVAQAHAQVQSPDAWPAVVSYAPWLEEVWLNYISNAVKYGGNPPSIQLGFDELAPVDGKGAFIRFWVRDNGAGLTPEEQAELFAEFARAGQNEREGYGLGLSIVRRIVTKLGGQVGLESQVGQGSKFWFMLPAQSKESPRNPA